MSKIDFAKYTDLTGIQVLSQSELTDKLLTPDCLRLIALLHRLHNSTRKQLLAERITKAVLLDKGLPLVIK